MSSQLSLFIDNEQKKELLIKHSQKTAIDKHEKPKKTLTIKLKNKHSKIFYEKISQEQSKSHMTQEQADFIIYNLLNWDNYELEFQLEIAGATEGERDFYLNFIYPFARKNRDLFEKLWQLEYEESA